VKEHHLTGALEPYMSKFHGWRSSSGVLFLALFLLSLPLGLHGAEPVNYLSSKGCAECHETLAAGWRQSGHARALESLRKSGQENLPGCVRCHVTGYEKTGGFIDQELTPDLAGVQCEECHRPGRLHAAAPGKGAIISRPGIETCRRCHTKGQDPNFDYAKKVTAVHTAPPASAKATGRSWLSATPAHVDFGTIDEGTPAAATVTLRNMGDKSITITDLRTN
jgi:hypothetical protein